MSNSGTTVSLSICFYLCHPQPVGQQTSLESQRCEVSPVSFLAVIRRKIAQDLLPTIRQTVLHNGVISHDSLGSLCAKNLSQGSSTSQPLYNSKSYCSLEPASPLPRLHGPYYTACSVIHLSKHPAQDSYSIQMEQARGSTGKTNTKWNGGAGWGKRKKSLSGLQTPQSLFEELG